MPIALVTGIEGQDGPYLAKMLLEKGYQVFGSYRSAAKASFANLEYLGIREQIQLLPIDLLEYSNIWWAIERVRPDEVYNFAALSYVGLSFEQPLLTAEVDAMGPLRWLEALRTLAPQVRFYQASSSEMFGTVHSDQFNEQTAFHPRSPYGFAKVMAYQAVRNYREAHGMYAVNGILFNHESPLRGACFVTRKISKAATAWASGNHQPLLLGNLEAKRDWGYAPEYMEAVFQMMHLDKPDDFVIGTGEMHSVRQFVEQAFRMIDLEIVWSGQKGEEVGKIKSTGEIAVTLDPDLLRPAEIYSLRADFSKAKAQFGWRPQTSFEQLVEIMVRADITRMNGR